MARLYAVEQFPIHETVITFESLSLRAAFKS
jgi:hypothetical protein